MSRVVRHISAPFGKEALCSALAFEIHSLFPGSRLLVGLALGEAPNAIEIDILGLIDEQKLVVMVSCEPGEARGRCAVVDNLCRVCSVDPELLGLALVASEHREERAGFPAALLWRRAGAGFDYAYAWVRPPFPSAEGLIPTGAVNAVPAPQTARTIAAGVRTEEEVELWSSDLAACRPAS